MSEIGRQGRNGFLQISGEDLRMQQMEAECNKQKEIMWRVSAGGCGGGLI